MRFLSIAIFAVLAVCVSADNQTCSAGRALDGKGNCVQCPANQFSTGGSSPCRDCPAGSHSDKGSGSCDCDDGYISPNGSTTGNACSVCPAGQVSNSQNTRCTPCGADKYAEDNICRDCPDGFTSPAGSTSCTPRCQAGYKVKSNNQCEICPAGTYSAAGDTKCTSCPTHYTSNPGSAACTPEPSNRPAPPRRSLCSGTGMKRCNVWSGMGGVECINVLTTLDSCGGCVGLEGDDSSEYTGQDCSAIPNVDEVKCVQGKCRVKSCRYGYEPSGSSCVESATHAHSRVVKRSHSRHDPF